MLFRSLYPKFHREKSLLGQNYNNHHSIVLLELLDNKKVIIILNNVKLVFGVRFSPSLFLWQDFQERKTPLSLCRQKIPSSDACALCRSCTRSFAVKTETVLLREIGDCACMFLTEWFNVLLQLHIPILVNAKLIVQTEFLT